MNNSVPPDEVKLGQTSLRRYLARSPRPIPRAVRWLYRSVNSFTLPVPRFIGKLMFWTIQAIRYVFWFVKRVCICEPIFKACCKEVGRGVRTDMYIHGIQGKGDIILGDDVLVDGRCYFSFANRFVDRPVLQVGDHTKIGTECSFLVGKRVQIGRYCHIAPQTRISDSSGHPLDPTARRRGEPPLDEDVKEIIIGDDVWIGVRVVVLPGCKIGNGSTIGAGAVVRGNIPPNSVVIGNPGKVICQIPIYETNLDNAKSQPVKEMNS